MGYLKDVPSVPSPDRCSRPGDVWGGISWFLGTRWLEKGEGKRTKRKPLCPCRRSTWHTWSARGWDVEVSRCAQPTATHRAPVAAAHEASWLLPPPWPPCSLEEKEGWEGKPMILLACCQLLRQFLQKGGELWKEGAAWRGGRWCVQGPGRERSLQPPVMEANGTEWGHGGRSPEERGEVERGRGSREKQLLAQLGRGASIPADLSQLMGLLWFTAALWSTACGRRGFHSPVIFPCCVSSGEYEMRVVQGSWLGCVGRARSCCQCWREEHVSHTDVQVGGRERYPSWVRPPGVWPVFAIPSLPQCCVCVSFCPHSVYLSKVCESWWLPGPSSLTFQFLGPREELSVALDSHGVAALTRGDTEQLQSWMQTWAIAAGNEPLPSAVVPPLPGNPAPGAQWHHPRQGGTVLRSPGYSRALSPRGTR